MTEYLDDILPGALDVGICAADFWNMSIAEINDVMESKKRVAKRERKQRIIDLYMLANLESAYYGTHWSKDAPKPPMLWELFPQLFKEEKEEYEKENSELLTMQAGDARHAFAERFNKNKKKGVG